MCAFPNLPPELIDHIIDDFFLSCKEFPRSSLAALRLAGWATHHRAHILLFRQLTISSKNVDIIYGPCPVFRHPENHIPVLVRDLSLYQYHYWHQQILLETLSDMLPNVIRLSLVKCHLFGARDKVLALLNESVFPNIESLVFDNGFLGLRIPHIIATKRPLTSLSVNDMEGYTLALSDVYDKLGPAPAHFACLSTLDMSCGELGEFLDWTAPTYPAFPLTTLTIRRIPFGDMNDFGASVVTQALNRCYTTLSTLSLEVSGPHAQVLIWRRRQDIGGHLCLSSRICLC